MYAEKYEAHDPEGRVCPRGGTIETNKICGVTVGIKPSIEILKDRSLRMADQYSRVDQRAQEQWRRRIGMEVQFLDKIEAARERHHKHLEEFKREQRVRNWNWETRANTMADFKGARALQKAEAGEDRLGKEKLAEDDYRNRTFSLMAAAPERILDTRVAKLMKEAKGSHEKMEKYHTRWLAAKEASRPKLHERWMTDKLLTRSKESEMIEGIRANTPEPSRQRKKTNLLKVQTEAIMGYTTSEATGQKKGPSVPVHSSSERASGFNQNLPQDAQTSMNPGTSFPFSRSALMKMVRDSKKDLDVLDEDNPLGHKAVVKPKREKAAVSRILWKMAGQATGTKAGLEDLKKAMNAGVPPESPRGSPRSRPVKGILKRSKSEGPRMQKALALLSGGSGSSNSLGDSFGFSQGGVLQRPRGAPAGGSGDSSDASLSVQLP